MNVEVDPLIEQLYRWSDVSGVLLMGIIGGTIARKRGYDIVGFFFIAMFASLGGGMIRDVLINRGTVAAMNEPEYLILAFTGAVIARFVYFKGKTWDILQSHGDAIVSALWAATGTVKAITFGLPVLPCIMMGVFTAVGGSMIRDIVTGHVPQVFGGNQPTVIPAVAAAVIVLVSNEFDMMAVGMVIGPIVSVTLSLLGYWGGWRVQAADEEWAPINETAAQLGVLARQAEGKSRAVGRRIEPTKIRAWRHKQMEKALQRRIEKEVLAGTRRAEAVSDAQDFMDEFTTQFEAIDEAEMGTPSDEGRAEDRAGDRAEGVAEDTTETFDPNVDPAREVAEAADAEDEGGFFSDIGVDISGDSYDGEDEELAVDVSTQGETPVTSQTVQEPEQSHSEMLDLILHDEKLTDEFIERLAKKYEERQGK